MRQEGKANENGIEDGTEENEVIWDALGVDEEMGQNLKGTGRERTGWGLTARTN